jgi:segregation and condensation protein B
MRLVRHGLQSQPATNQLAPTATDERAKIAFLRGPTFRWRHSIDTSSVLPNGSLLRSHRLARLEAALIITRSASAGRLARLARLVDAAEVHQLITLLNRSYERTRSAFRVEQTAAGYQLLTRPDLASWLDRLHQRQDRLKLSQPAQETLTIIAYQQPVTRADVEAVRGVQSTDLIRQLIDRSLIRVAGEDDSLGRPFLYATTKAFLDMFGLGRLEDLPDYESLRRHPKADTEQADTAIDSDEDESDADDDDADEDATINEEESLDSDPEDQSEAA